MNHETKQLPEQNPQDYGPKKPEILALAKKSRLLGDSIPESYIIPNVPASDNPDVGGCGKYLECFTALQAYLEQISADACGDYRNQMIQQYLLTTGISLSSIWSELSAPDNYCFESPILLEATYGASGYGYEVIDAASFNSSDIFNACAASIAANYPVIISYACESASNYAMLKRGWQLYVGYNTAEQTLIFNDGDTFTACGTWYDHAEQIIIITETGLAKPDMKEILANAVRSVEMPEVENRAYGYAAYEKLIALLSDDARFKSMSDDEISAVHQALKGFFSAHAEARGNSGGGAECLYDNALAGNDMAEPIGQIMFYGYNGHQISYVASTALSKSAPAELRDSILRPKLIYCAKMLMDNDDKMLSLMKEAAGMTAPSVMRPTDGDYACYDDMRLWGADEPVTARSLRHPERADRDAITASCRAKQTYPISFSDDLDIVNTAEYRVEGDVLHIKTEGSGWEPSGALSTKQTYTLPLKIDAVITGDNRPLTLGYSSRPLSGWGMHHYGFISNYDWAKKPGDFVVKDVYVNYGMDYDRTIPASDAEETEISWILHRDYMAILVNRQVVHYCENMPYMHFDVPAMPVRIGSVDGRWAKVKSLTVTELE